MQKIVINDCFGGFGLSHKAILRYAEIKGFPIYWRIPPEFNSLPEDPNESFFVSYSRVPWDSSEAAKTNENYFSERDIPRDDPALIQVIKEMKKSANRQCANLKVVSIPDGVEWEIEEYDGSEWISEKHRTWR